MTQEKAYEIIKKDFGENVIVLGHTKDCIFWIYSNEEEENYKCYKNKLLND